MNLSHLPCVTPRRETAHHPSMNTELTTTTPQAAPPATKREKKERIPIKIRHAVDLLASGQCKTQKAAAERSGLSEEHLSRSLKKSTIQAYLAKQAAENISRGVLRASARYVELIEAQSEHVAARVSERFLEHGGIIKPQQSGGVNVSISNNIQAGYVIDLTPQTVINANSASTIEAEKANDPNAPV
jgi:hypothetical protein